MNAQIATTQPSPTLAPGRLVNRMFDGAEIRAWVSPAGKLEDLALADIVPIFGFGSTGAANRALRPQHKGVRTWHGERGERELSTVTRAGLFRLMMRANTKRRGMSTDEAEVIRGRIERFQDWVTDELLPAVDDGLVVPATAAPVVIEAPTTMLEALRLAVAQAERIEEVERVILAKTAECRELAAAVEEKDTAIGQLAPAAADHAVFCGSSGDYSLREAALILIRDHNIDTGQNKLLATIRDLGMVDRRDTPYAHHRQHLRIQTGSVPHKRRGADGVVRLTGEPARITRAIRITPLGLSYVRRKMTSGSNVETHVSDDLEGQVSEASRSLAGPDLAGVRPGLALGRRVRAERERQGLSQAHLAGAAGLSLRTVEGLEAGGNPTLATTAAIAHGLGLAVTDLLIAGIRPA